MTALIFATLIAVTLAAGRFNEVWTREQETAAGIVRESYALPRPQDYIRDTDVPASFTWGNVSGVNYLTKNLNQHLPQYCGSCWAHGALSALADRVKIARGAKAVDINLSVQYILNCGNAGSCHGGSAGGVYQFVKNHPTGVPYDTCNPYLACSSESQEGFCAKIRSDTTCNPLNTCRTCPTFGEPCEPIDVYPNVTIAEFGTVAGEVNMMKEIMTRGPIAAGIDAVPILDYAGGIATGQCGGTDHEVSIVGWGVEGTQKYWIVRNSWGEFWGEMGYVRVAKGNNDLCLESDNDWATPLAWTEINFPCDEGGDNCDGKAPQVGTGIYNDPGRQHVRTNVVLPNGPKLFDDVTLWALQNVPAKERELEGSSGKVVKYVSGKRLVAQLLESPYAAAKGGELFAKEIDAVFFCENLINKGRLYRAKFVEVTVKKKTCKQVAKLPRYEQTFVVEPEQPYVWNYEPVTARTKLIGATLLAVVVLGVGMPLWPVWARNALFYVAMSLLVFLLAGRPLAYYVVFLFSGFKWEFEILPNLDDDKLPFYAMIKPLYSLKRYKAKVKKASKAQSAKAAPKPDTSDGDDEESGADAIARQATRLPHSVATPDAGDESVDND